MKNKVWYDCEDCGRRTRSVWRLKGGRFCYWCYCKRRTVLRAIPIFGANMTERHTFQLTLTPEQRDMLNERLIGLRITKSKYLRDLVLADLEESKNEK